MADEPGHHQGEEQALTVRLCQLTQPQGDRRCLTDLSGYSTNTLPARCCMLSCGAMAWQSRLCSAGCMTVPAVRIAFWGWALHDWPPRLTASNLPAAGDRLLGGRAHRALLGRCNSAWYWLDTETHARLIAVWVWLHACLQWQTPLYAPHLALQQTFAASAASHIMAGT